MPARTVWVEVANAQTRVAGTQVSREGSAELAATGENTPMELGALLLLTAVALRLAAVRRRETLHM